MKCTNCGADIENSELICQYCGHENEKVARREHEKVLNEYKKKTSELKNMPDKIVNRTSRYILIAVGWIFVLFVAGLLISLVVSKFVNDNSLEIQNKHLERLEEYYDGHEYEKMFEYLDKKDLHGATYEKYWRIAEFDRFMDWRIEALQEKVKYIGLIEVSVSEVAECMGYSFDELARIDEMEKAGFIYGEGEAALEIKAEYVAALMEYMLLTEEEIELGIKEYGNEEVHYELAGKAIERILAK